MSTRVERQICAVLLAVALTLVAAMGLAGCSSSASDSANTNANTASVQNGKSSSSQASQDLQFRSYSLMKSHYEKHGVYMGFESMEDYLAAANAVVANPDSLHKKEAEDGDDVYYLEESNDFVVVSTDGYLRTYFRPDSGKKYYDRQ